jgi:predicted ArsR family transcriptional regulator
MLFIIVRLSDRMKSHTRTFLATISEQGADALLRQLRDGARTEAELRVKAKLSHRGAHERLAALERLGVIAATTRDTNRPGRPPRVWELVDAEAVARLADQAETLRRALKGKDQ